jgi:hypothetical protein
MAYINTNNNGAPVTGVLGTTFGGAALASVLGLFGGNGMGGLFGGGNPASSAVYQLSQKDTEIAELKAERYSDHQAAALNFELGKINQRLAAIEAAAPLREKIVEEQIGFANGTLARLVQPMIPGANVVPNSTSTQSA